jgi:hypothetical protein
MTKADLKKDLKAHYRATGEPGLADIGELRFLMVDGAGDPNSAPGYADAVGTLYAAAYRIKFLEKAAGRDFVVPPLEGLWWAEDMDAFLDGSRDEWQWTMMIALPGSVPAEVIDGALGALRDGDEPPPAIDLLRAERFAEGRAAQILHVGPYADEEPTIERLHAFIDEEGLQRRGKHHEIYLGDPRRTAPERLRTIIRQPVA